MNHDRAPYIPRKPAEYEAQAGAPSMNDLLQSLNIDDDVSYGHAFDGTPEHYRTANERPSNAIPPQTSMYQMPGMGIRSRQENTNREHGQQMMEDVEARVRSADDSVGKAESKSAEASPQTQRVARKPVDTTPTRRVYYSPDDLDDLIADRTQPRPTEVTYASGPGHAARPDQSYLDQLSQSPSRTMGGLPNGSQDFSRAGIPRSESGTISHAHAGSRSSISGFIDPVHNGRMSPSRSMNHLNSPDLRPLASQTSFSRTPSPPRRGDGIVPVPQANPYAPYPTAFQANHELAPRDSYSSPRYMPRPPSRQDSMPMRTQSSLSNHSYRSPERENSFRNDESQGSMYPAARMPSPDRPHRYFNASEDIYQERSNTASVPPVAQARRGRQKGEIVAESDLPAMPLLFAESNRPELDMRPQGASTPVQGYPPGTPSPSRSPTRSSNLLPSMSPRKRQSFGRAPDLLQSVKVLPIKPIKCPPLCLEERYHPFPFVKTNKFKIKVYPAHDTFVAGGEIFGHIDVISDEGLRAQFGTTQVLVGDIGVEVIGYEEIQNPESGHDPRSFTFLYSRKVFQRLADKHPGRAGDEQILTSAVLNEPPADQDGYRTACKGTTTFPFSFPLPVDAPSSADLSVARIKYLVTGYATVKLQGSHEVMATSVPIRVVEAWDVGNPIYDEPIDAAQGRDIANYHEIAATAKIARSLYMEGETLMGNIRIANHSSRKIREVKFLLVNRITFFGDKRDPGNDLNPPNDFVIERPATGHVEAHVIAKGADQAWTFQLPIPSEQCLSVRNCTLFEVQPVILIKISTGPLQKSTRLYITSMSIASRESMVDDEEKLAPSSIHMRWSNLPFLYRFQRIVDGVLQPVEKGSLEVTDLITYYAARERVRLLSPSN